MKCLKPTGYRRVKPERNMVEVPQGTEAFQGRMFRLETRAREIAVMASLT